MGFTNATGDTSQIAPNGNITTGQNNGKEFVLNAPLVGSPGSYAQMIYKSGLSLSGSASISANLSVLALRRAEASQKWKEVSLCTEEDYPAQIQAHFGARVPKELSGMVRYLGGIDTSLDINEVTNTNLTDDNAATLGGKGSMSARGTIRVDANGEYGIVMCVFHALPMLDYVTSGVNPECLRIVTGKQIGRAHV